MKKINKTLIIILLICISVALSSCKSRDYSYEEMKEIAQKKGYTVIEYSSESDISTLRSYML